MPLSFDMFNRLMQKTRNFLNFKLVIHTSLLSKIYWTCPCWIFQYKIKFPLVTCTSLLESICWIWPLINWRSYSSNFTKEGITSYMRELHFTLKNSAWVNLINFTKEGSNNYKYVCHSKIAFLWAGKYLIEGNFLGKTLFKLLWEVLAKRE